MRVRVLFFASLRERVGRTELDWEMEPDQTVGDLWRVLGAAFPALADSTIRVAFAVNQDYVDTLYTLHDNDEVALIPPVSGGTPRCIP